MNNSVQKIVDVASAEVGYLEKSKIAYAKNPAVIFEKTAGAGRDNITKYGYEMHKLSPAVMDFPAAWCDCFVDWCFMKAYGIEQAKQMLGGRFDDYTVNSCGLYKKMNALGKIPKVGAQVFFTKNGKVDGCYHTGLVVAVDTAYFYTIEGNTSSVSAVVANGGAVAKKKYSIAKYANRVLFGYPKYAEKESNDIIARQVIKGLWGSGEERKKRLSEAGYNYADVQKNVNALLGR